MGETCILRNGEWEYIKIKKMPISAGSKEGDIIYSDGRIEREGKIIVNPQNII